MRLRRPLWASVCDDCGHVSHYWQKPWYTPRPRSAAEMYIDSVLPSMPIFSKEALILIGKLDDTERDYRFPHFDRVSMKDST